MSKAKKVGIAVKRVLFTLWGFRVERDMIVSEIDLTDMSSKTPNELLEFIQDLSEMERRMVNKSDLRACKSIEIMKGIIYKELDDRGELPF